jgi:penicillin G amidase
MFRKLFGYLLAVLITLASIAVLGLFYVYAPITRGTLYLTHAMGEAEILRETDTSIPHVFASSEKMAIYTQGFLHAQERLWQMDRMRRMTQGRMSEIMGERAIGVDKFFKTIGLHRWAEASLKTMDKESMEILEAYAAGVNDYIANLGFGK